MVQNTGELLKNGPKKDSTRLKIGAKRMLNSIYFF